MPAVSEVRDLPLQASPSSDQPDLADAPTSLRRSAVERPSGVRLLADAMRADGQRALNLHQTLGVSA
jgi:hypothetical protein